MVASGSGGAAGLDSAFSPAFTVRPAAATNMVFTHLDTLLTLGQVLDGTAVQFQDAFGNQADTLSSVTLSLGPNPWGATLHGSTTEFGTGLVTFGQVSIDRVGDYGVVASAPGFAPETSTTVTMVIPLVYTVAAGGTHSCALSYGTTGGENALCWGANGIGQLGRPASAGDSVPAFISAGGRAFVTLALGAGHTCAITAAGAAYCWGDNTVGELGSITGGSESDSAQAVGGGHVFRAIAGGGKHTCALAADSTAYCWGSNFSGQLGDSGREVTTGVPVATYGGRKYVAIAAGASHTCAIGADSSAYCWGDDSFGQLGDSVATGTSDTAVLVSRGHKFRAMITAGDNHTCAFDKFGAPLCWGRNNHGQLGDHLLGVNSDTAVFVTGFGGIGTLLVAGGDHTCGAHGGTTALCWGSNANGELGSGTPPADIDQPAAVAFTFLYGVDAIAAGSGQSCVVGGFLYCWGKNQAGQVGDATTIDRSRPVAVFKQ
jgi:alpha-tubulin suppressor-like RCC1 family protein